MNYWIFKLSEQELYPDEPGNKYVYDNTHSVKVKAGDLFVHLDKTQGYSFTATGKVKRVTERKPTKKEKSRTKNVRTVYTAHLTDVFYFTKPLSIHAKHGTDNRDELGITDVNQLGWSQSMARLSPEMYNQIIELVELRGFYPEVQALTKNTDEFLVPDDWAQTKKRAHLCAYKKEVKRRCQNKCVVCGLDIDKLLDVAHISPYATDKNNRANPSNGICLCKLCHKAFDSGMLRIFSDGSVEAEENYILKFHAQQIDKSERQLLIRHASQFLDETNGVSVQSRCE
ncbi:HNH endonuclease [Vibrio mediterranei]